jgi:hypothetical protein
MVDTEPTNKLVKARMWSKPAPWIAMSGLLLAYLFFNQRYQVELNITPRNNSSKSTTTQQPTNLSPTPSPAVDVQSLQAEIVPTEGVEIPIEWGDLGKQMVASGVIDADKFRQLFGGQLPADQEAMLAGTWDQPVKINQQNSRFILDLFWALGLGNKNSILTEGEMVDEQYGGAGNFASTGGWSLAKGDAMDHYSKYSFITLTSEQQKLVEETSKNIYRPCCGNSTHFPDCNHGMAMLGLLELMASQGATEQQMYDTALAVNSVWFPQTYLDLATYFEEQGQEWDQVDSKLALGQQYSSGQGYKATRAKIKSLPQVQSGGGGCGV